jgi:S-adenosylmethionine:tRNA ribosyltransferase-isomerase
MIAAGRASQRPADAKLLVLDRRGRITHAPRSRLVDYLRTGDVVVANDAATLPASLCGTHLDSGSEIEVRLAGRRSLALEDAPRFTAIFFGAGDFHQPTEHRPRPPLLSTGDRVALGPLTATIEATLDHPRLVTLRFDGEAATVWAGLARHGRPIQYAHVPEPLELWDVWTPIAAVPVAFEAPSASFALDWEMVRELRRRGIELATITLAAGISSTGDPMLDRRLPLDEPYRVPVVTARAIARARANGGRIVAVGTTVVRALEHASSEGTVRAGDGIADQRIDRDTRLGVVDVILSGTHEPETSHYNVLRAFASDPELGRASVVLETHGYRTHEFGDSVLIERRLTAGGDQPDVEKLEDNAMKLNHLNLTVTDVAKAHGFLQKHFGLRDMGRSNDTMAGLYDDDGFALVLMKAGRAAEVTYPQSFHIGFTQPSDEKVNGINRRLRDDGLDVPPPGRVHGAWGFYFNAPRGFMVEVACW